jgi:hypothetical protein
MSPPPKPCLTFGQESRWVDEKNGKQLHWAYEISLREISLHIEPIEDQLSYTNEKE